MGVFPQLAKKEMEKEYLAWLDRKGDYEHYIKKVIQIHLRYIAGKTSAQVDAVAKLVVQNLKNRVYRYTRGLIRDYEKQGHHLMAISGSPTYYSVPFRQTLAFRHLLWQRLRGQRRDLYRGRFKPRYR